MDSRFEFLSDAGVFAGELDYSLQLLLGFYTEFGKIEVEIVKFGVVGDVHRRDINLVLFVLFHLHGDKSTIMA